MADCTERPCGNDATHGRREEAIMSRMDESIVEFVTLEQNRGDVVYYYSTSRGGEVLFGASRPERTGSEVTLSWRGGVWMEPGGGSKSLRALSGTTFVWRRAPTEGIYTSNWSYP